MPSQSRFARQLSQRESPGRLRMAGAQERLPPHPSCPCGAIHLPLKGKAFTPLVFAKQRSFAAPTARRKAGFFKSGTALRGRP